MPMYAILLALACLVDRSHGRETQVVKSAISNQRFLDEHHPHSWKSNDVVQSSTNYAALAALGEVLIAFNLASLDNSHRKLHQKSELAESLTRRRTMLRTLSVLLAPVISDSALAYDAKPVKMTPEDRLKRAQALREEAEKYNAIAASLVDKVSKTKTAEDYDAAMSELTLWIIGTGDPLPPAFDPSDVQVGPIPEGFRTRELVAACRSTLKVLPRYVQFVGEEIAGLPECVKNRRDAPCLSAGPLAQTAFQTMYTELGKRAPRQYDKPDSSVMVKVWI